MAQNLHAYHPHIKICEAVNCYESATEKFEISAGKFGTITLNLCRECAVTKFGSVPVESKLNEPTGMAA